MTGKWDGPKRIVVSEYPKSGGTWIVSMLGDALRLPKRDIYVGDDYRAFDVRQHPWYAGAASLGLTESCVIKSHELPNSSLLNFPAQYIHLVRDGRDVVVSKYIYDKEFCVRNGIYEQFEVSFDDYLVRVAVEWRDYVLAWLEVAPHTCQYEDFLQDPFGFLRTVLTKLGTPVPDSQIRYAVEANTKDAFRRALDKAFKYNTFVRKGTAGDWRNHFTEANKETFKEIAGDALIRFGYETNTIW